jgi:hypothetical protein
MTGAKPNWCWALPRTSTRRGLPFPAGRSWADVGISSTPLVNFRTLSCMHALRAFIFQLPDFDSVWRIFSNLCQLVELCIPTILFICGPALLRLLFLFVATEHAHSSAERSAGHRARGNAGYYCDWSIPLMGRWVTATSTMPVEAKMAVRKTLSRPSPWAGWVF